MMALMRELQLETQVYEQYSEGAAVAEYRTGQLVKQAGMASMAGSLRLKGGLNNLVETVSHTLQQTQILKSTQVTHIALQENGLEISCNQSGEKFTLLAEHVVLAAPPRVIAETIAFSPDWNERDLALMTDTPTWMAGQAKFCAQYSQPFWREQGLSGDAVSEIGPLGEIHDASSADSAPYALFGFVGVPATARAGHAQQIQKAAIDQLTRMFGSEAATPTAVFYKDWAEDELTATDADRQGPRAHAHQIVNTDPHWNNQLYWAGSETSSISSGDNGYLEGALAAAERVVAQITNKTAV